MAYPYDLYQPVPRNLMQYYLGRGAGSEILNQNYQPTDPLYSAFRSLSTENPNARKRNPLASNLLAYIPTQMGGFTPSAGLTDVGIDEQTMEAPLQTFDEAYPDLSQQAEAAPRRTLGLLGDMFGGASALDEYMTPEQRAQLQNQGVMAAAMQLLAASGPSRTPVGLGQALGQAYGAGQQGYTAAQQNLLQSMAAKQKMDEYKRARDIEARISGALVGEGGAVAPGETISPEQAINAPGGQAGPTVERAAMIGTQVPAGAAAPMSAVDIQYDRYMRASTIAAQSGDPAKAKAYSDLAKQIRPTDEVIGEPFRGNDGNFYSRLKSGGTIPFKGVSPIDKPVGEPFMAADGKYYQRTESGGVKLFGGGTVTPAAKPMGQPQQQLVDGKAQMVQYYDDGTFKPISGVSQVAKPVGQPQMQVVNGVPTMMQYFDDGTSKPLTGVSQFNQPSTSITDVEFLTGETLAGAGAPGVAQVQDYRKSSAAQQNVKVETGDKTRAVEVNKDIVADLRSLTDQARTANQTLANVDRILPALDKAITGPAADFRTTLLRVGQFMGVAGKDANEILSNTQNVVQGLAQQELNAASYTKGQGTLTGPEREMLKRSAAGDQNMSAAELRTALIAAQKMAQFRINDQQEYLNKFSALPGSEQYVPFYTIKPYQSSAPAAADADGRPPLSSIIKPKGAK